MQFANWKRTHSNIYTMLFITVVIKKTGAYAKSWAQAYTEMQFLLSDYVNDSALINSHIANDRSVVSMFVVFLVNDQF